MLLCTFVIYLDFIHLLIEAGGDLTQESAEVLMRRGMVRVEDGVVFSHDTALRSTSDIAFSEPQLLAIIGSIPCPILFIRGHPT